MLPCPRRFSKTLALPRRTRFVLLAAVALLACVSGCFNLKEWVHNGFKVGPNYQKPPAPVANEWIDSRSVGVNVAASDLSNWWHCFNDPILNSLIDQAYRQNLDVRTAGTRILAARAIRNIAVGNAFPQLQQAFADLQRVAVSGNKANIPPNLERFFGDNLVGFNLAWELDFWGRFRRGIESAEADLDASIENYDDALVLLISEVASNYVQIRVFQQRLRYVADNVAIQTEFVNQAEERLKGGVGRKIDQGQMRSNLTDTLALKEQLEIGLRLANNRLCVLLGEPVHDLMPKLGEGPVPVTPPEVVVGIPADLLRRRPDVRRAERLVAAQSARIGIAVSDLYPHIRILGTLGYQAENFADVFSTQSFFGNVGPSVRWDILNYGRLINAVRVQDALWQTRVLDYQNAALQAGREVEDGIVLFLRAQSQTKQLLESAKEAKVAAEEALVLSKDVKFDLNRAFVTSNFLVGQQDKLAVASGDIALGLIQVYRALGGGWQIRCAPTDGKSPPPGIELLPPPPPTGEVLPAPAPINQTSLRWPTDASATASTGIQLLPPQVGNDERR